MFAGFRIKVHSKFDVSVPSLLRNVTDAISFSELLHQGIDLQCAAASDAKAAVFPSSNSKGCPRRMEGGEGSGTSRSDANWSQKSG